MSRTPSSRPRHDRHGFELWLRQHLDVNLSLMTAQVARITFDQIDGADVALMTISASSRPVFCRPLEGKEAAEF